MACADASLASTLGRCRGAPFGSILIGWTAQNGSIPTVCLFLQPDLSERHREHTIQAPKRQEIVGLTPDERWEIAGKAYDMIPRLENEANDGE